MSALNINSRIGNLSVTGIKENLPDVNTSEVFSSLWGSLPPEILNKVGLFFDLGKWFLIILIVYFIILILKSLMRIKDSKNLSIIAKSNKKRNEMVDMLIFQNEKIIDLLKNKKDKSNLKEKIRKKSKD